MMILNLLLVLSVTGVSSGVLPISEENVTSRLYSTVVLPCTFPFVKDLTDLTVIWEKKENQRKSFLYKILKGQENLEVQDPGYRGRVELSTEITQGDLSLTLRDVTYEDEGTYYCRAANIRGHGDKKVTLSIDALNADDPTVTLVTTEGKRCMKCMGSGVYSVPQVQWITTQGQDLSNYGRLSVTEQNNGQRLVESVLEYEVKANVQVLCHIMEGRLRRSIRAVISDGKSSVSLD